jgi:glycosyltransferase involved in cell wall biosynthesis
VKIGYVVKRYPRYSETFIVNEILAHEAAGMEIEIFSVLPPEDGHFQDVISRVRAPRERPPRIVGVGRLVEKKGFVDLIEACAINSLPPAPRAEAWPAREEGV